MLAIDDLKSCELAIDGALFSTPYASESLRKWALVTAGLLRGQHLLNTPRAKHFLE